MPLEKITTQQMDAKGVCAAPDILNGTPAQNKSIFDRMVRELIAPAYNAAVDAIAAIEQTETGIEAAEDLRVAAENLRATAETAREQAESGRVTAEEARAAAESLRASAEELRASAEQARAAAEQNRVAAEQERVDTNNGIVAQATAAAKRAEDIAKEVMQAAKPPYIGENGNWFVWDDEAAAFVDSGTRAKGDKPVAGTDYWTEADKEEIAEEASKMVVVPEIVQATGDSASAVMSQKAVTDALVSKNQLSPEFAESVDWLKENGDQSKMYVLPDGYIYAYMMTEVEAGPSYTNILPLAVNADGTEYVGNNGEDGYKTDYRLNSSKAEVAESGMCCTGFMPITPGASGILRLKNITPAGTTGGYLYAFDNDKSTGRGATSSIIPLLNGALNSTTGIYTIVLGGDDDMTSGSFGQLSNAYYLRLSIGNINENTIITWNEEITESGSTTTAYAWTNTGRAFVPADYEDRIIAVEEATAEHTTQIAALEKAVASGGTDKTETDALNRIKVWDKPVYDAAPVTLLGAERDKPALTAEDRTIDGIYAKYRALMAAYPRYITETNMGKCTASDSFTAVDMLRFDIKEPDGLTQPGLSADALHETKPKIIFMSGVHHEWVGVWGLYYAIEEIMTNPDFDDIRRNAHIIVIPCANPYGLVKPLGEFSVPSHVNANGIAIHNNFGVGWVFRGDVGEYNYSGTEPYSELETQYIDAVMAENSDAIAFVSCHNNDYSTYYEAPVIWASSATYYMCNVAFRLIDKLSKAWLEKYGDTLKNAIDAIKINMDADDYRLGRAMMSSSAGTEQQNATKYGIQATNLEISRMMKVFSGTTDGSSEVMTRGAEVYANFMRTILWNYDHNDKKDYAPNLPWKDE